MEAALHDFFSTRQNFEALYNLIEKKYMSLRQYECLVMHLPQLVPRLDTVVGYERFLEYYGKRNFDVFLRGECFQYEKFGLVVVTNVPQLRFFYFFIKTGLHEFVYAEENKLKVKKLLKKIDLARREIRKNAGDAARNARLCLRSKRRVHTLLHMRASKKHTLNKPHSARDKIGEPANAAVPLPSHLLP
jgi:hypothetical protein